MSRAYRGDSLDRAAFAALVGLILSAWISLILADLGWYPRGIGAYPTFVVPIGFAVLVWRWPGTGAWVTIDRPFTFALGGLILLGAIVYLRPHEYVLGGLDPGVYVSTAAHIARNGSILWVDPEVAALPADARDAVFGPPLAPGSHVNRLKGFYMARADADSGLVVPHGLHLLPAAIAVGMSAGGIDAGLHVPPLFALGSIVALSLLARALAGGAAGLAAGALLLVNPLQVWFGRYPAAETLSQATLLAGILGALLAERRDSRWLALLAGMTLGIGGLARLEAVLPLVALAAVWGCAVILRARAGVLPWLAAGSLGPVAHAIAHNSIVAPFYVAGQIPGARDGVPLWILPLGGAAIILVITGFRRIDLATRVQTLRGRAQDGLWRAALAAIVIAAVWLWFVRPLDLGGETSGLTREASVAIRNRLEALPRLGWFLTPAGVALGLAGLVLLWRRCATPVTGLLLASFAIDFALVMLDPRIHPEYPWAARRWLTMTVPAIVLGAGIALASMRGAPALNRWTAVQSRVTAAIPAMLTIGTLAWTVTGWGPLVTLREYRGATELIHAMTADLPPNAIVLFDDDLAGWRFSAPLQFIGERASFILYERPGGPDAIERALTYWESAGKPLYLFREGEALTVPAYGRLWQRARRFSPPLEEIVLESERMPRATRPYAYPIGLYEVRRT